MSTMPPVTSKAPSPGNWEDGDKDPEFKPLNHEDAVRWRTSQPKLSAWRVVGVQMLVGLVAGALGWLLARSESVGYSVWYGAASVVIPTALMAWGVTSSAMSRRASGHVISAFMSFVLWEGVKLLLAVAMLWSAPRIVPDLNWLALLAGLVVVLKVYWFGFWIQTRR
ncbi:MAG: ATP synthase subunit I [Hydrogenophaga sp.]|jgi:ATP synthase protein I|nr:ATP synthase subunit I [Hydrogenophaga sp.]